jgi:hypothetical protein
MARIETTDYSCDNCGKKLLGSRSLDITTSKSEENPWSRLHVRILHIQGYHNESTEEDADLCKKCAMALLSDALERVKKGERASAGTEEIEQSGWLPLKFSKKK